MSGSKYGKGSGGAAAPQRENMWEIPPAELRHGFMSCNRLLGNLKFMLVLMFSAPCRLYWN
jgi:hypothetical protein